MFPEIHLWYNTCPPPDNQYGGQLLFPTGFEWEWETSCIAVKCANHSATSHHHSLCLEFAFKFVFVAQAQAYTGEQLFSCSLLGILLEDLKRVRGMPPSQQKRSQKRWLPKAAARILYFIPYLSSGWIHY